MRRLQLRDKWSAPTLQSIVSFPLQNTVLNKSRNKFTERPLCPALRAAHSGCAEMAEHGIFHGAENSIAAARGSAQEIPDPDIHHDEAGKYQGNRKPRLCIGSGTSRL